ncbi:MAG: hypothetical protein VB082_09605 [Christensenella sp.]|nr:hypothetical protein [Christensenella sp.]
MQKKNMATIERFYVTIDGMENHEWQGTVRFAGGAQARFESLPMLLRLVNDRFGNNTLVWGQEEAK